MKTRTNVQNNQDESENVRAIMSDVGRAHYTDICHKGRYGILTLSLNALLLCNLQVSPARFKQSPRKASSMGIGGSVGMIDKIFRATDAEITNPPPDT